MAPAPHAIDERPLSTDRVPTLTEVVDFGPLETPDAMSALDELVEAPLEAVDAVAVQPAAPALSAEDVVEQVLRELSPRIDMLLESRLREALAPALARAADGLIRDARAGVSQTLRELVQEAVARALHQHRGE